MSCLAILLEYRAIGIKDIGRMGFYKKPSVSFNARNCLLFH
jgi:hypothetical protein